MQLRHSQVNTNTEIIVAIDYSKLLVFYMQYMLQYKFISKHFLVLDYDVFPHNC